MKSIISSEVNDLFEIHMQDVEPTSIIHPKIKEVETFHKKITSIQQMNLNLDGFKS